VSLFSWLLQRCIVRIVLGGCATKCVRPDARIKAYNRTFWEDAASRSVACGISAAFLIAVFIGATPPTAAQSGDPIRIGFSMALTGPLAPNGKQALFGAKIWEEEINAKGGLLGRKVELVNYDDQSNPANVPGIYTKLLDVDKVDLVNGPYGTNLIAPALPVVMQKGKLLIGLFGLDANKEFHYQRYFSMLPAGPKPSQAFTEGFFQVAARQKPKPGTVALAAEDAEFSRNACEGARENAKTFGFTISYDKSFPPGTTDFSPIVRALQAANADLVVICSYPLSSVGILLAANELNLTPKPLGGAMVGLQSTVFKDKLKSKLNGVVNYETWVPSPKLMAPAAEFFKVYQERAKAAGTDLLGYYLGGWGYAYFQLLGQAIEGAQDAERREAGRVHAQPRVQDNHGRRQVWAIWRVDQTSVDASAVSWHHRCGELGDLARHELSDGAHARGSKDG
jgi:branched-chain amino acid transport system substrate-binding protein